mmetsp:Transcript_26332/g.55001  ORF Transcript_26332/g.55001 Transcript_26332/m.55001 type:complete len:123 (+) Transcript_26332:723-1091(+)
MNDEACCEMFMTVNSGHLPTLRSLELNRNSIQSLGCIALAASLLNHPNSMLIRVFLDENSINDEGAMALANGLVGNTCLKTYPFGEMVPSHQGGTRPFPRCFVISLTLIIFSTLTTHWRDWA